MHERLLLDLPDQELPLPTGRVLPSYSPVRASQLPNQGFLSICIYEICFHPTNTNALRDTFCPLLPPVHCQGFDFTCKLISDAFQGLLLLTKKSVSPKICEWPAELENAAILVAHCSSSSFPHVNWLPASHSLCLYHFGESSQLFITASAVWLNIDQILALSHRATWFVFKCLLLQLRTSIIS